MRVRIGQSLMNIGNSLEAAFPGGFECPPWASMEVRVGKGATIRFFAFYEGHIFGHEVQLVHHQPILVHTERLRRDVEVALEQLRSALESHGAPVPTRLMRREEVDA